MQPTAINQSRLVPQDLLEGSYRALLVWRCIGLEPLLGNGRPNCRLLFRFSGLPLKPLARCVASCRGQRGRQRPAEDVAVGSQATILPHTRNNQHGPWRLSVPSLLVFPNVAFDCPSERRSEQRSSLHRTLWPLIAQSTRPPPTIPRTIDWSPHGP